MRTRLTQLVAVLDLPDVCALLPQKSIIALWLLCGSDNYME